MVWGKNFGCPTALRQPLSPFPNSTSIFIFLPLKIWTEAIGLLWEYMEPIGHLHLQREKLTMLIPWFSPKIYW